MPLNHGNFFVTDFCEYDFVRAFFLGRARQEQNGEHQEKPLQKFPDLNKAHTCFTRRMMEKV
jgi:hypothetical protein